MPYYELAWILLVKLTLYGGVTMNKPTNQLGFESQFVEIPLILDKDQMLRLEQIAMRRGQSIGSLVRHLLRNSISCIRDAETLALKSSA